MIPSSTLASALALRSADVRRAAADVRRARVRDLLTADPGLSTDRIAAILDVDRSTIRRDRNILGLALARGKAME